MATNFQENKKIARQSFEAFEKGDLFLFEKITDTNKFRLHFPGIPNALSFDEALKLNREYLEAFPDVKITFEEQIGEGNFVLTRVTYRATHKGELQGIAPTNKQVTVTAMALQKIENGKITEEWDEFDALGMMRQVGAVPELAHTNYNG